MFLRTNVGFTLAECYIIRSHSIRLAESWLEKGWMPQATSLLWFQRQTEFAIFSVCRNQIRESNQSCGIVPPRSDRATMFARLRFIFSRVEIVFTIFMVVRLNSSSRASGDCLVWVRGRDRSVAGTKYWILYKVEANLCTTSAAFHLWNCFSFEAVPPRSTQRPSLNYI